MKPTARLIALATALLPGLALGATATLQGVQLELDEGWTVVDQVDAVSMQSVTVKSEYRSLVLAVAPTGWERAEIDVMDLAQARLEAVVPIYLEEYKSTRWKAGDLKFKGKKGSAVARDGTPLVVECGLARTETQVLAACSACPKPDLKGALGRQRSRIVLAGEAAPLDPTEHIDFFGIDAPVPAGWNAFQISEGKLPFLHLAQRQSGFIRFQKLPPAFAGKPLPWDMIAGWVAEAAAGVDSQTESLGASEQLDLAGVNTQFSSYKVVAKDREGRVVFVQPIGRKDVVLLGVGLQPQFTDWLRGYVGSIAVSEEALNAPIEGGSLQDLLGGKGQQVLEGLKGLAPGASDLLDALGGKKEEESNVPSDPAPGTPDPPPSQE